MRGEVIAIGDELTSGQRLDTNSQWLSQQLGELGVSVAFHTTVGDDLADNVQVLRQAIGRADLIVCSGGLGPTADDLTREAMAAAVERELVLDEGALAHIEGLFARRGRPMPERNRVQAMFPRGARVIPNPHGSAPGIDLDAPREGRLPARIIALPGVPAELKEMWSASVVPALMLTATGSSRVIRHRRIKCFGVGESDLEQMLPDLIRRGRKPQVGITAHQATLTLRITAEGGSDLECQQLMAPTLDIIRECLRDLVFGEEDDELEHAVCRLLASRGETLATAAGTGLLAQWLAACGDAYRGGVVSASEEGLRQALRLGDADSVSPSAAGSLAARLAIACRELFRTDHALALMPFPSASSAAEVRHVPGALAQASGVLEFSVPYSGHPEILAPRALKHALDVLRKQLVRQAP